MNNVFEVLLSEFERHACEDNADNLRRLASPHNLLNGIDSLGTIWSITTSSRCAIGLGSVQGREED